MFSLNILFAIQLTNSEFEKIPTCWQQQWKQIYLNFSTISLWNVLKHILGCNKCEGTGYVELRKNCRKVRRPPLRYFSTTQFGNCNI